MARPRRGRMEDSSVKISKEALTELVRKAGGGDRAAQSELIEATQDGLLRFCLRLCSRKELAEDICQEALIRALSHLSKLKDPSAFSSWLFQTAKNIYFDYLKSPQNKLREDLNELALIGEESDTDIAREVLRALDELSPEDRLLLILIDMEGYAYSEAAKLCSLPEANIPSRLHRIRLKFMEKYKS